MEMSDSQIYELAEHCTTEYTIENIIQCSSCETIGKHYNIDPYNAAVEWEAEGWRVTKHSNIYCPKCAEIKLKPKKNNNG